MASVARNPQGAYNDPYVARYNSNTTTNNDPQYTGLGLQQQQGSQPETPPSQSQSQNQQPSKKALAITSRATRGSPPPPLMGSAIVLVNDSALHCFGGRLENRELTNCHYVLDVETGYWQSIIPADSSNNGNADKNATDPKALFSLSLTTDPVNINSGSLSDTLSIPPQPRYFHTVNAYGTSLILFGGMGAVPVNRSGEDSDNEGDYQSQMAALADLHVYDIITQRWQHKTPTVNQHTPRARWAHLATILDHFLVVIGGTDTHKNYVEDACVLDLHTWEWVASIQNIGQCGSYRTVAATGPSIQATGDFTPSTPSFPSADAFSPQISSNLSWPTTESGPIDAMATISMVLSGRISAPSSTSSSQHSSKSLDDKDSQPINVHNDKKATERLMSGDLTPAFKAGSEMPSIYLYSNYNFQNLRRELKIITPHYTHPSASVPTFSMVEKTEAIEKMGSDLPPGLRFPQGHVYQNQLILTGTLIVSGKAPTLAIYAFNLTTHKWDRLDTDTTLDKGSWNRSLLHPATGTLLVFGHYESNADADYSNRIQHHNHLMMVNLQAYGLYERPIPSFLPTAQDLGHDLLREPGLNDMEISSVTGTLFGANSTILAARWPDFATMLLSPPYVTPLILELPVPDEVVPMFLYYLYTGALPLNSIVTPGVADYLLILARRYQLNGLHALAVDILHQTVTVNPIRVYSSALMAGELGLQARAVELAMNATANKAAAPPGLREGASSPFPSSGSRRRISVQPPLLDSALSRNYSNRVPPPSSRLPFPPERRRAASHHSRDSVSTDGGLGGDGLMQQYNTPSQMGGSQSGGRMAPSLIPESGEPALYLSSPEPGTRSRKMRTPPMPPNMQHTPSNHPMSYMSTSSGGSMYDTPLASPGLARSQQQQQQYQQQYQQQAYPSPLSPNFQTQPSFSAFNPQGGYTPSMRGSGSDGAPSVYGQEENDDGSSVFSGYQGDLRAQQAKRRLQMQMQYDMEQQQQYRMRQEYSNQQQQQQQTHLVEQQQLRDAELILQQQQQQQQRYLQSMASSASLSSKAGGGGGYMTNNTSTTAESIAETVSSQKTSSSKANSVKSSKSDQDEKKKGVLAKLKPPKPKASGAALMKSAGF
ncbi:hypothetical protein EC991_002792 [Linnemannia zychae]|nr:hypothetical protein EC991_002792 [Linnemannia zychae]